MRGLIICYVFHYPSAKVFQMLCFPLSQRQSFSNAAFSNIPAPNCFYSSFFCQRKNRSPGRAEAQTEQEPRQSRSPALFFFCLLKKEQKHRKSRNPDRAEAQTEQTPRQSRSPALFFFCLLKKEQKHRKSCVHVRVRVCARARARVRVTVVVVVPRLCLRMCRHLCRHHGRDRMRAHTHTHTHLIELIELIEFHHKIIEFN